MDSRASSTQLFCCPVRYLFGLHLSAQVTYILPPAFSASNSYLFAASRTIYGLACDGQAPKILRRTTKGGLPVVAIFITLVFGLLSFMNLSSSGGTVFQYLYTVVSSPSLSCGARTDYGASMDADISYYVRPGLDSHPLHISALPSGLHLSRNRSKQLPMFVATSSFAPFFTSLTR